MVKIPKSMQSKDEFFAQNPMQFEITEFNKKTHLTKNVLMYGIANIMATHSKQPFHEVVQEVRNLIKDSDTSDVIDFVKEKFDINEVCQKGGQQMLIEAQKNYITQNQHKQRSKHY